MSQTDRDRFQRIAELFEEARVRTAAERDEFLDQACADDEDLRHEVESLLDRHDDPSGVLEKPAFDETSAMEAVEQFRRRPLRETIGRYRLIERIGEGGMGVVYLAEQEHPKRTVALKALRPGLMSRSATRRFEHEAEVLAKLSHPNVAQVFDAGTYDDEGVRRPWFAMEYVCGQPLTSFADRRKLNLNQRLALMAQVCDAVQHAHARGVVHRDLKPSNILVDEQDRVKVVDFGVARALSHDIDVSTMHTEAGQLVGTLPYMSPEQVAGDIDHVDQRSDVYALGVVCYELLTGELPHQIDVRNPLESARLIRDEEPRTLAAVNRDYRGDLDTIIGKALSKEANRRYETAGALADDLRRFLNDEPIAARPPSTWYQARKFAKRNRTLVGSLAVVFVSLLVTTIISVTFGLRAAHARRAEAARAAEARQQAYVANLAATDAALRASDMPTARRHLAAIDKANRRHFESRLLASRLDLSTRSLRHPSVTSTSVSALAMTRPPESMIHAAHVSPDGSIVASGAADNVVRLWNVETGAIERELTGHTGRVQDVRFSHDGAMLVSASDDGSVRIWDTSDWSCLETINVDNSLMCVDISTDAARIAAGGVGGIVYVWDAIDGEELHQFNGHTDRLRAVDFDAAGSRLASCGDDGVAIVWNLVSEEEEHRFDVPGDHVRDVDFHADGTTIATAGGDGAVRLWNLETGAERYRFHDQSTRVQSLEFAPNGERLMAGCSDGIIRIWDLATSRLLATLTGHEWLLGPAHYNRDGTMIVSGSYDGTVRLWEAAVADEPHLIDSHTKPSMGVAISPDGAMLATASYDGMIRVRDTKSGRELASIGPYLPLVSVEFSRDGKLLAATGGDGPVRLYEVPSFRLVRELEGHTAAAYDVAFYPDSSRVVTGAKDNTVRIWDLATGETTHLLEGHEGTVSNVDISPDGRRIVTGSFDNTVRLWDAETGEVINIGAEHTWYLFWVGFSPDGRWLVSTSYDGTARLWDPQTGAPLGVIQSDSPLYGGAFSHTGPRLYASTNDGSILLWDLPSRKLIFVFRESRGAATRIAVAPNDDVLAFISGGTLGMIDATSINERIAAGRAFDALVDEFKSEIALTVTPDTTAENLFERLDYPREPDPFRRHAMIKVVHDLTKSATTP